MFNLIRVLALAAAQVHSEPEAIYAAERPYQLHKQTIVRGSRLGSRPASCSHVPRSLRFSISGHRVGRACFSLVQWFWDEISSSCVIDLDMCRPV